MKQKILPLLLALLTAYLPASAYDFMTDDGLCYNINSDGTSVSVTNQITLYYETASDPTYPNLSGAITIPTSVTNSGTTYSVTGIGFGAFRNCSSLTSVTIGNSVTTIGEWAFDNCSGLTSVYIPNSVTEIELAAFEDCSSLTTVDIPPSVTSIGNQAFYRCSSLTSVNIPASVAFIGDHAFAICSNALESITVDAENEKYDSRDNCNAIIETESNALIAGCKNTIIPNSVTSIGNFVFWGCEGMTSVTIPNSVTTIGYHAFRNCSGLTSVTIGNSVAYIGYSAFYGCSGLTTLEIPNSVTEIDMWAFGYCSGLTSVTIGNSVTSIGDYAFVGCSAIESITVDTENEKYDSRDNCNAIIETESNTLIAGCKNTIIPNSVTSIGISAFSGRSCLTSITIPNSVTSIGDYAFYNCTSLTSVSIPNSVNEIGLEAFYGCSNLKDFYSYIEDPSSVPLGTDVFNGVPTSTCVLHVPAGTTELYRAADQWSAFTNIVEDMTSIDNIATDHKSDGIYYNLLGQPVKNPTTGIYIYNGKKVFKK